MKGLSGKKSKSAEGRRHARKGDDRSVFHEVQKGKGDPVPFQNAHPHHASQSPDWRKKGADIASDDRSVDRPQGTAAISDDLREEHRHRDVVDQIRGEEGSEAIPPHFVSLAEKRSDLGGEAILFEGHHQGEHRKDEGNDRIWKPGERMAEIRGFFLPKKAIDPAREQKDKRRAPGDDTHRHRQKDRENEKNDANAQTAERTDKEQPVFDRRIRHLEGNRLPEFFHKKQDHEEIARDPRHHRRRPHREEIMGKRNPKRGAEINVGRIADEEKQTPGVRGHEFAHEIRNRIDFRVFAEENEKRGKGQNDDVVAREDREQTREAIKNAEQNELAPLGEADGLRSQKGEEARFIKDDRKKGH